jgi:hypothetical protein
MLTLPCGNVSNRISRYKIFFNVEYFGMQFAIEEVKLE